MRCNGKGEEGCDVMRLEGEEGCDGMRWDAMGYDWMRWEGMDGGKVVSGGMDGGKGGERWEGKGEYSSTTRV